jgi:hypothetical protein
MTAGLPTVVIPDVPLSPKILLIVYQRIILYHIGGKSKTMYCMQSSLTSIQMMEFLSSTLEISVKYCTRNLKIFCWI